MGVQLGRSASARTRVDWSISDPKRHRTFLSFLGDEGLNILSQLSTSFDFVLTQDNR